MGDLIPLADYARGDRVLGAADPDDSPWFGPLTPCAVQPVTTCDDCPARTSCRVAGSCQWGTGAAPDVAPDVNLRLVEPPDIIA